MAARIVVGDREHAAATLARASLGSAPPISQTSFHSSSRTGCTERREFTTSTMSFSRFSALTAASVTGFGTSATAFRSTHFQVPVSSFESGCASAITSTMPTTRFSSPVW